MQIPKKTTAVIASILMFTITITLVVIPIATAHTPPRIYATYPRIHVAPDPVGVGQEMIIVGMMNWALPGATYVNDIRFRNLTATITKPDGTTYVQVWALAPDPGGSAFFSYTPDQVGVYTVLFEHHGTNRVGTVYDWGGVQNGNIWLPSSATRKFTVQAEPVGTPLVIPLPTEYWSRPIDGQNWQWSLISSNWLGGAWLDYRWQPDGTGPKSAHVLWTKVNELGGIVGGTKIEVGQTFYSGFSYETRFNNPLIIAGILFYPQALSHEGSGGGYVAVDLRTGEELWRRDDINPTKGQLFDFTSPNQHGTTGGILYQVSGSTWYAYDALTGKAIFNLTSVPSGTEVYDHRPRRDITGATVGESVVDLPLTRGGDIIRYVFGGSATTGRWMALWSVASAIGRQADIYGQEGWRVVGRSINATNGYLWNVTIPANLPSASIVGIIPGDIILGSSGDVGLTSLPRQIQPDPWRMWAISDKPETRGQLLWMRNYTALPGNRTIMLAHQPFDPVNRVWLMTEFETGARFGYDIDNGNLLWGPLHAVEEGNYRAMQLYSSRQGFPVYGIQYISGYGGEIKAISTRNGTLLWTFNDTDTTRYSAGIPWGLQPLHASVVADGVVYAFAGEHSPNTPLYKGNQHYAIDAFTGKKIWSMYGWSASGLGTTLAPVAIADGILVYNNAYDGRIYSIGKGPSATTVSASPKVSVHGSSVIIEGTVIDISAGTKQHEQAARFPQGVPAVSDASMSAWMEYVYMQKPRPADAVGVDVILSVLDPNGNFYDIGTATSDASGTFGYTWKPLVPGQYTVYARFAGSESYWPSYAQTYITVEEAPQATPPPTPPPAPMTDTYVTGFGIGIILAIVAVGIVIVLVIKKK